MEWDGEVTCQVGDGWDRVYGKPWFGGNGPAGGLELPNFFAVMPLSGPASYVPTISEFRAFWQAVDGVAGGAVADHGSAKPKRSAAGGGGDDDAV